MLKMTLQMMLGEVKGEMFLLQIIVRIWDYLIMVMSSQEKHITTHHLVFMSLVFVIMQLNC